MIQDGPRIIPWAVFKPKPKSHARRLVRFLGLYHYQIIEPANQSIAFNLIFLCTRYRLAAGTIGREIRDE